MVHKPCDKYSGILAYIIMGKKFVGRSLFGTVML